MDDKVIQWLENHDGDEQCEYCRYSLDGCTGGVHGGPNGPIYPACVDADPEDYLDVEAILEAIEEEEDAGM